MNEHLPVFYSPEVLNHQTGNGFFEALASPYLPVTEAHPENDLRLRNMIGILKHGPLSTFLNWHDAPVANKAQLERFHTSDYIRELEQLDVTTSHRYSSTTILGPGGFDVVKVSAGLSIAAAQHVWQGQSRIACAMCRPPGHHAQPSMADGYCFVNNIGVAVRELMASGLERAVVIDWDVHHGNGTQEGFYDNSDILTVSMHMDHGAWGDSHVQKGSAEELGSGRGIGANLNIPLPYGSGDIAYTRVFREIVMPAVVDHRPEVIFIANGQDANQFDPNGRQIVTMEGFFELARLARELAETVCDGRLVIVQEGGYAISYAAYCLHAGLCGFLGQEQTLPDPLAFLPEHTENLDQFIAMVQRVHG